MERLKKIKFYGNESFSDKVLSGQMMVKAGRSFNPFKKKRGIDSAELEEDIIRIEEFYRDNGYLNARVSDVEREPDGEKVNLIIQVAEGKKFTINKVSVSGIKAISVSDVLPLLEMKNGRSGRIYHQKNIKVLLMIFLNLFLKLLRPMRPPKDHMSLILILIHGLTRKASRRLRGSKGPIGF